jgi:DNA-binding response OmpR family regulator
MKLGARDYIVKPFDRSSVPMVLNKVLRQRPSSWSEINERYAA